MAFNRFIDSEKEELEVKELKNKQNQEKENKTLNSNTETYLETKYKKGIYSCIKYHKIKKIYYSLFYVSLYGLISFLISILFLLRDFQNNRINLFFLSVCGLLPFIILFVTFMSLSIVTSKKNSLLVFIKNRVDFTESEKDKENYTKFKKSILNKDEESAYNYLVLINDSFNKYQKQLKTETNESVKENIYPNSGFTGNTFLSYLIVFFGKMLNYVSFRLLHQFTENLNSKYVYSHMIIDGRKLKSTISVTKQIKKKLRHYFLIITTFGMYAILRNQSYFDYKLLDYKIIQIDGDINKFNGCYLGNTILLSLIKLGKLILNVVTLFLINEPLSYAFYKFEINRSYINGRKLSFNGNLSDYWVTVFKYKLLLIVTLGIYALVKPSAKIDYLCKHINFSDKIRVCAFSDFKI